LDDKNTVRETFDGDSDLISFPCICASVQLVHPDLMAHLQTPETIAIASVTCDCISSFRHLCPTLKAKGISTSWTDHVTAALGALNSNKTGRAHSIASLELFLNLPEDTEDLLP
jgi:hypothetical protein